MNPFWMVRADLRKNFLPELGTTLLLAFAFSVNVAAGLLERGVVSAGVRAAEDYDLVVGAAGSRLDLVLATVFLRTEETLPLMDYAEFEVLAEDPRVAASSPFVLADNYRGIPIVGVGPRFPEVRRSLHLAEGSWPTAEFQAVVGAGVPLSVGDEFESGHGVAGEESHGDEDGHDHDTRYAVVGKLASSDTPWDRSILTPVESLWSIHGHGEHEGEPGIAAALVRPKDFPSAYALRAAYRTEATTTAFPGEILAGAFGLMADAKAAVSALGWMLQLLVFAAVLLSLLASLPSKFRWVGLLRSLGAGPVYVFLTLWIQSAIVFLVAGGVGLLIGRLGAGVLASGIGTATGLRVPLEWSGADIVPLLLFWLIGLVGSLLPALIGYRTSARAAVLGQ